MTIYYKDGFYLDDQAVPAGAVEISEEKYIELLNGQSNGQLIISDKSGNPILIDPAPSDFHELKGGKWVLSKKSQAELLIAEKSRLINIIATRADAMKSALLVGYPQTEIDSFYRQEKEALAYQVNKKADTPMLKMIAQARGVPFDLLVQKVIEKSNQFAVAIGVIIGQRQKFEDRILAAGNVEQLSSIESEVAQWEFTLES